MYRRRRTYTPAQKRAYYAKIRGSGAYYRSRPRARYARASGSGAYRVSRARSYYNSLSGRGGYYDSGFVKTMGKYVPKGTFSTAGSTAGRAVAGPIGAALGDLAGRGLAAIAGFGSYQVKSNSMLGEGQSPPAMHSINSALKVRHREYICDIYSSSSASAFTLQAFPINPGLVQSFPWLSAIAQQYEEHKPLGVVYEYKTLSATAIASSTNSTMGGIIMSTDYNAINPNFVNKQQMDNTEYTTSGAVYDSFYHPVECDPRANPLSKFYVRAGAVPTGSDQRMYDLGVFQIASFGVQGTNVLLGELWCTYEWEFAKPISTTALGQDVLTDHWQLTGAAASTPLGNAQTLVANSSINGTISSNTTYNFPAVFQEGAYIVVLTWNGTAAACTAPAITGTNCTLETVWEGDSTTGISAPTPGTSNANFIVVVVVTLTAENASVAFGTAGGFPTGTTKGDLWITQIDSNIVK